VVSCPALRLRSCILIELGVGGLILSAAAAGAVFAVAGMRGSFAAISELGKDDPPEAPPRPAPEPTATAVSVAAVEPAAPAEPPEPAVAGEWHFFGQSDESLVAPLREAKVTRVKLNRGGTSLSLRLDFDNGARAACKPSQVHPQSQPRREIAAYRINRLVGLHSVPPAIGRIFDVRELAALVSSESGKQRFLAEIVPEKGGVVHAELSWWIPVLVAPARIDGFAIDSTDGVVTWKRYLTIGEETPERVAKLVAQLSDMVLFDFLINNSDRWSGNNVTASEDGQTIYFIDNTLAFGNDWNGHRRARTYFERSQKFSRRLVERLRTLTRAEIREALAHDTEPFEVLLEDSEIHALLKRRDYALRHIDKLIAAHGADAVLAFP
jgi:hypothetical protein